MSEIPVHSRPRRLVDWINPAGARKVHSLIDKVYKRKNLEMAWECVRANRGSGGVDGQTLEEFAAQLDQQLDRLQSELKEDVYRPRPVRQVHLPRGHPRRRASLESSARWESPRWLHNAPPPGAFRDALPFSILLELRTRFRSFCSSAAFSVIQYGIPQLSRRAWIRLRSIQ